MRRFTSLIALSLLATACASVPMASPEADRVAKEFRTAPGKSNLYVFRDESLGGAVKMTVVLDGRMLGDTASKTFLLTPVAAGPHALVSKTENDARLEFTAVPGKNVYVWQEVKMGVWAARSDLHLMDEEAAKERISACSLATGEVPGAAAPSPSVSSASDDVPRS